MIYAYIKVASSVDNGRFIAFLSDALYFSIVPYHFTSLMAGLGVFSACYTLHIYGYIWFLIIWGLSFFIFWRNIVQWNLVDHRGRIYIGLYVCIFVI
jgi:hypothetical protein